jgi:hypothetical protein
MIVMLNVVKHLLRLACSLPDTCRRSFVITQDDNAFIKQKPEINLITGFQSSFGLPDLCGLPD